MGKNQPYNIDLEELKSNYSKYDFNQILPADIHVVDDCTEETFKKVLQHSESLKDALLKTTEKLKETEAQLAQAGKLASLGTLGAEVAHELNNPLTVVSSEADEILDAIESGYFTQDFASTSAQNIKKHADRMRTIIDHIRQYSRDEKDSPWTKVNINDIIEDSLILFRSQLQRLGIDAKLSLQKKLPKIWGHFNKLLSILQNLISNAVDAFETVGKNESKLITITSGTENKKIIVTISDNAGGIPEKVRSEVFKPFFTTKEAGKGTGLGLAIVQNLIKEHRGSISVSSKEGKGTTFTIKFPLERRNKSKI